VTTPTIRWRGGIHHVVDGGRVIRRSVDGTDESKERIRVEPALLLDPLAENAAYERGLRDALTAGLPLQGVVECVIEANLHPLHSVQE
jgi:hypothetical protein